MFGVGRGGDGLLGSGRLGGSDAETVELVKADIAEIRRLEVASRDDL